MSNKIKRFFSHLQKNPKGVMNYFWHIVAPILPDRLYLKVEFWLRMGYWTDLTHPKTFNEKLQWLKLESKKHPEYTQMVDKVAAKDYAASIIGEQYIIPTLGVWYSVDDIDWDSLPNQFVVKAAGDSGGIIVCKDKSNFDIEKAKAYLKKYGERSYYILNREYPYKNVPHRYIAETYMEDESGYELKDYKFFCFNGEPKFMFVATGRQQHDTRFDFYDMDFKHIPVLNGHPNADNLPTKPDNFDEMKSVAAKLSEKIPHVRIDLYNINGKIYFGEITFFHWSGIVPFEPTEYDLEFGKLIDLPTNKLDYDA